MIHLDDWQKEVLGHDGDLLLCTGRRVGKTYIMARKAVDEMAKNRKPIIIVSLTEEQAMLIISMALNYATEKYPKLIGRGKYKPKLKELTINGVKLKSRPVGNTGDSVRGFEGGILYVDEASRMPEHFWMAAKPIILTTNGKIWMSSTPHGKQGYFWERFNQSYNEKDPKARFKVIYVTTEQVMKERPISASWTQEQREGALRILEQDKEEMSMLEYGQEYLGLFLEDLQQFFPDEMIRKCQDADRRDVIIRGRDYYLGVDIARMGEDESTFEVFERYEDDTLIQAESQATTKTLLSETTEHIINMDALYDFRKIFIDDEGIGVGVFDFLVEDDRTKRRTVSINNSKRVIDYKNEQSTKIFKEVLYNHLRYLMETGKIHLLKDNAIFQSLKSVQYEYTKDANGNYHMHIFGNYTHHAEGIIRAAWCLKYKELNMHIYSI